MNLAIEELSNAHILYDNGLYRGSIVHSYYAMFDAAKALLLTKGFITKKHENALKQLSKDFVHESDFDYDIYIHYSDAKTERRKASYDVTATFDESKALEYIGYAEEFIEECKRFL